MKKITIIYYNSNQPVYMKGEDKIIQKLFDQIYNAMINNTNVLLINGNNSMRIIRPDHILDCVIENV